jgi:hypothetical protein
MGERTEQRSRRRLAILLLLLVACVLPATLAFAQDAPSADRAVEFEDLGLTQPPEISARGAGLSGSVASTTDLTALIINPALLCRIKQRTPMLGLARQSQEIVTTYSGASQGLTSDRTGLQFIGAAAAIPVFQGSLVPAVAVYRAIVSDLDIAYEATRPAELRTDAFRLQQAGTTFAFAVGFGIDLASVLSAGVSVSALEGGYNTLRQTHTSTETSATTVDDYVIDDIEGDLNGFVAHIGVVLYAHRHAHLAVNVTTPAAIDGSTNQTRETTHIVENGTGTTTRVSSSASAKYVVPYRIEGGLALPWGAWLVSAQVGSCDWTTAAIDGQRLRLQSGDAVLRRTVDYRAGVEWTAPSWPLRLRAGVARLPQAPRYLEADRIDNDEMELITSEKTPLRYSFGAGIALKQTIVLDASFTHTHGERATQRFSETRNSSQVILEGSYWF